MNILLYRRVIFGLFLVVSWVVRGPSASGQPSPDTHLLALIAQIRSGKIGGLQPSEAHALADVVERQTIHFDARQDEPHRLLRPHFMPFGTSVLWSEAMTGALKDFLKAYFSQTPQEEVGFQVDDIIEEIIIDVRQAVAHISLATRACGLWPQCPGWSQVIKALYPVGRSIQHGDWLNYPTFPPGFQDSTFFLMDHLLGLNKLEEQEWILRGLLSQKEAMSPKTSEVDLMVHWEKVLDQNRLAQTRMSCLKGKGFTGKEIFQTIWVLGGEYTRAMSLLNTLSPRDIEAYKKDPLTFVGKIEKGISLLMGSNPRRAPFFACFEADAPTQDLLGPLDEKNWDYTERLKLFSRHKHALTQLKNSPLWSTWLAAAGTEDKANHSFLVIFSYLVGGFHPIKEVDVVGALEGLVSYLKVAREDPQNPGLGEIVDVLKLLVTSHSDTHLDEEFYRRLNALPKEEYHKIISAFSFLFGANAPGPLKRVLGGASEVSNDLTRFAEQIRFRHFLAQTQGAPHALDPDWGASSDPKLGIWPALLELAKSPHILALGHGASPDFEEHKLLPPFQTLLELAERTHVGPSSILDEVNKVFTAFEQSSLTPRTGGGPLANNGFGAEVRRGMERFSTLLTIRNDTGRATAYLSRFLKDPDTLSIPFAYASSFRVNGFETIFTLSQVGVRSQGLRFLPALEGLPLPPHQVEELRRALYPELIALSPGPILSLLFGVSLEGPLPMEDFMGHLKRFSLKEPTLLPSSWLGVLEKTLEKKDVRLGLLAQMHKLNSQNTLDLSKGATGVFMDALGWGDHGLPDVSRQSDSLSLLFQTALEIQGPLWEPAFNGCHFDAPLFQQKKFKSLLPFLEASRNLFYILGAHVSAWEIVMNIVGKPCEVTETSVDSLTQNLQVRFEKEVGALFAEGYGPNAFSSREFLALKSLWGQDLDPIFVLVARLKGQGRREGVALVARILKTALDNTFHSYKFYGDPSDPGDQELARAQMSHFLSESQQKAWTTPLSLVEHFDKEKAALGDTTPAEDMVFETMESNVLAHSGYPFTSVKSHNLDLWNHMSAHLADLDLTDPAAAAGALDQAQSQWPEPRPPLGFTFSVVIDALASAAKNRAQNLLGLARLAHHLLAKESPSHFPEAKSGMVLGGLENILQLLSSPKLATGEAKDVLLVTTTFHHPKLLLMVGDLVKASSCQNFRTGGLISTLPATAIDAHTQGVATWALKSKDFVSPADYKAIVEALEKGQSVHVVYTGQGFLFSWTPPGARPRSVSTLGFPMAFSRQLVRLGQYGDGSPGVYLERAYQAPHWALQRMGHNHRRVLELIRQGLGAGPKPGPITLAKTRNPLGLYSDRANGIKKGAFTVQPLP